MSTTKSSTNDASWRRQVPARWRVGWLLVLLWLAWPVWALVPATPHPRQLTVADGLPSNEVNDFAEDSFGYLWLATSDGLARYDGRGYRIWRIEDGLRDNHINAVHVDGLNRVWIGTQNAGLVMLTADRSRFHYYDHRGYPVMQSETVLSITSTADNSVWFGTQDGLYWLDPAGKMHRFLANDGDPKSLPGNLVKFLQVGVDGSIWAGTNDGVARWTGHDFERLNFPGLGTGVTVDGINFDQQGNLWIALSFNGLWVLQADGKLVEQPWKNNPDVPVLNVLLRDHVGGYWLDTMQGMGRLDNGRIRNVPLYSSVSHALVKPNWSRSYEDRDGGLWFASPNAGLWHLPPNWRQFAVLNTRREDPTTVFNPYALGIANAKDGRLWLVGTRGVLDLLNPETGEVDHRMWPIDGLNWGYSVYQANDGHVWMGVADGIVRYDPDSGEVKRWHNTSKIDPYVDVRTEVVSISQSVDDRLWFLGEGAGIQVRNQQGHVLENLELGTHGLARSLAIHDMHPGPGGQMWLATNQGLLAWNDKADRFEPVPGTPAKSIYSFQVTDTGVAWLGAMGELDRYLWRDGRMSWLDSVGERDGFPVVEPSSLVVDSVGVAWLGSSRGLIRVDPASRAVRVYGVRDGLPSQQFHEGTLVMSPGGQVAGGTPDGLVLFDPGQVRPNKARPPLQIERVSARRGDRTVDLTHQDPLVIHDGDRDLRIVARLLSFADSEATVYRFRLSGYDPDWIEEGATGERLFSRLPSGTYTLEVQARTADNVWSQVKQLHFRVLPPWWLSPWGLGMIAVLIAALGWLALRGYQRRLQRRQEWKLALHKQELAEQASLAKTRFLATLGHEVRTPMTGVLGMSELLLGTELDDKQRSYTESIRRAGGHLLRLVNDALDLARIESGRLELDPQPFSIARVVAEVEEMMAPLARSHGLFFMVESALKDDVCVQGDVTRVRQILLNLIGNAIKFTEHGGVTLRISSHENQRGIRFEVADTGPGISAEQKKRLFKRFEQGEGARTTTRYGGSGLGLAICRELAVAMGGKIDLVSKLGVGTRFIVDLPLAWVVSGVDLRGEKPAVSSGVKVPALRILMVEDDATIAEVIIGLLRMQGHTVVHAPHGLSALTEVAEESFDLALLDLDLPGLDGFALARQLRVFGYDMPLIAVTARADEQAEPAAKEAGFDDFLRKPVTSEMLATAIAGVMRRRVADAGR